MVWSARADGHSDNYNQRFLDYLGKTLAQMEGWTWTETVHPEDLQRAMAAWEDAYQNGVEYRIE